MLRTLKKWGFAILSDEDDAVTFRCQMHRCFCLFDENTDDELKYVSFYICSHEDISPNCVIKVLHECNNICANQKQIKAYITEYMNIVVSAEFYYCNEQEFPNLVRRALNAVTVGVARLIRVVRQYSDDDDM